MASLDTIKNWFRTGLKPTQQQFWDTWDSFFHKDGMIPVENIENLDERFDEKADNEAFLNHVGDLAAHGKHGSHTIPDEGEGFIIIAHGLGAAPSYWNARPVNEAAIALGIQAESADENNIILTPVFTNNDGESLQYLWEAKL